MVAENWDTADLDLALQYKEHTNLTQPPPSHSLVTFTTTYKIFQ